MACPARQARVSEARVADEAECQRRQSGGGDRVAEETEF